MDILCVSFKLFDRSNKDLFLSDFKRDVCRIGGTKATNEGYRLGCSRQHQRCVRLRV